MAITPTCQLFLIGRLASASRYKGQGCRIGEALLIDALLRSLDEMQNIGALGVLVDAIDDEARRFYEKYGFRVAEESPLRLFYPMKKIKKVREKISQPSPTAS